MFGCLDAASQQCLIKLATIIRIEAFVFIMLTILGNSDVSVIYEVAPFLGSLLIIIYVVGIFFVIMNLFYAIIVSTLSDAKMEEDAKQKKKWAVMGDRINDTWKARG